MQDHSSESCTFRQLIYAIATSLALGPNRCSKPPVRQGDQVTSSAAITSKQQTIHLSPVGSQVLVLVDEETWDKSAGGRKGPRLRGNFCIAVTGHAPCRHLAGARLQCTLVLSEFL